MGRDTASNRNEWVEVDPPLELDYINWTVNKNS